MTAERFQAVERQGSPHHRALRGAIAAAVTPLTGRGAALDEEAIAPYCEYLVAGGLDGLLALGTTGEGVLLSTTERRRVAELYLAAAAGRVSVAVHCGAQTTADTVALSAHAAEIGADAVAVIAPPYFLLDADALHDHLLAAARACAPLPFYAYEFAARSGYAIPIAVIERLRETAPNLRGLKVSDAPFERLEPYLLPDLDIFVGAEALVVRALGLGAAGAVSGLAGAYPDVVARVVREPSELGTARLDRLRKGLERFPFHAALKRVLARCGVPIREDVRAPLRGLTDSERVELDAWLESS
ncbi:MAG: dihydrodipicolinate synthase family protein [Actinobacteria bacterium]|nr:dihydrodipicolinate synthase family protein [Actinomycetota bacterium]